MPLLGRGDSGFESRRPDTKSRGREKFESAHIAGLVNRYNNSFPNCGGEFDSPIPHRTKNTHMKIEFNRVTWYSKLGTLIVLVLLIPLCFYLWSQYEQIVRVSEQNASVIAEIGPKMSQNRATTTDPFDTSSRPANVSNIVGYIAGGAFVMYVPDWLANNWKIDSQDDDDNVVITPEQSIPDRDFSDMTMEIQPTTETFNAETLYNLDVDHTKDLVLAEVVLDREGDTRIYHTEISANGRIYDTFYLDGNKKTAVVNFDAAEKNYGEYGPKIRELVEGLGKGNEPQG